METGKSDLDPEDSDSSNLKEPIDSISRLLKIDVIDTGVGITEEDQKHLFKIFGKLKKTYHINQ
jgi:signal transduction histidine kinase